MKIGSHIKPRSGKARHVDIYGTPYLFAPLKDRLGVTHFVADVNDDDHAALLMANGAFYAFDKNGLPEPKLTRGATKVEPPPSAWPDEIVDEANALLDQSAAKIATAIGSVSSPDVVRAARACEAADKKRDSVLSLIDKTLDAMQQAGVK